MAFPRRGVFPGGILGVIGLILLVVLVIALLGGFTGIGGGPFYGGGPYLGGGLGLIILIIVVLLVVTVLFWWALFERLRTQWAVKRLKRSWRQCLGFGYPRRGVRAGVDRCPECGKRWAPITPDEDPSAVVYGPRHPV